MFVGGSEKFRLKMHKMRNEMGALFVWMLLCGSTTVAFVISSQTRESSRVLTTELYGVRSALQKRFRRYRDSNAGKNEKATKTAPEHYGPLTHEQQELEQPTVVDVMGDVDECVVTDSSIALPHRNPNDMTLYEKEFHDMMEEVESYTNKCVQSVADPKSRAIFAGARAGAVSPEVYRAFEILFQDLVPVRIAGRMVFKKLSQVMRDSRDYHRQQVDTVASKTGISASDVESGRFAFLSVADYKNDGDTVLNLDQLVETGVAATVVEMLGYEDFDDFVQNTCKDQQCELTFDETMVALQQCPAGSKARECNPHLVLQEIAMRMTSTDTAASERKDKYAKRYDEMVKSFAEWEQYMPEGEDGRWLEVLRGCFVGAKNADVVKALKIVYMDYSALRLAGDTIYGIMGKLIRKKKARARLTGN